MTFGFARFDGRPEEFRARAFPHPCCGRHQTAMATLTSGSEPRPALMNSTMTATATSKIPEIMKASK